MNILLVNPPIREQSNPLFPMGLGYIAAVLVKAGHKVEVLDIHAERLKKQEAIEKIKKKEFNVLGIGGIITVYNYIKWLSTEIKRVLPSVKIVSGGSVISSIPSLLVDKAPIDVGIVSEGESTILEVIDAFEGKRGLGSVKGIIYKENGQIIRTEPRGRLHNLDDLPYPAYELFPMDSYLSHPFELGLERPAGDSKHIQIITGRGCPFRCIYCHRNFGNEYRVRSISHVIGEISLLNKKYGVTVFDIEDETFTVDTNRVVQFCDALIDHKLDIKWVCMSRVDRVTPDLLKRMRDSGCIVCNFGLESGSQVMLDRYNKLVKVEDMENAIRWSREAGFSISCSFMIGGPGENTDTVQETIDFCDRMDLLVDFFITTPYPGTKLYEDLLRAGKIKDEEAYVEKLSSTGDAVNLNMNVSGLSDDELLDLREWARMEIRKNYYRKHPILYFKDHIALLKFRLRTINNIYTSKGLKPTLRMIYNKMMNKKTDIIVET